MNALKKLYYRLFPTYKETDVQFVSYIKANDLMTEDRAWKLSKKEDKNSVLLMVWICKKIRINK